MRKAVTAEKQGSGFSWASGIFHIGSGSHFQDRKYFLRCHQMRCSAQRPGARQAHGRRAAA